VVGPPPAVAAVRVAVRRWLATARHDPLHPLGESLCVAVSGGADSLALLAGTLFEAGKLDLAVDVVSVDHGLQHGSAERAAAVAELARELGARVGIACRVDVGGTSNIEALARRARYDALASHSRGRWVLLGHTLDDQAESVLLGLGRGSGARAIAGMSTYSFPYGRPLLTVRRAQTRAACLEQELPIWDDPHNDDPRFTRVRIRNEALPLLEEILGGGVAEALATTADLLRDDERAVDELARRALAGLGADPPPDAVSALRLAALADQPAGLRRRIIKLWLERDGGFGSLTGAPINAVDALVSAYHGQGPAYLPGGRCVARTRETINLTR